LETTLQRYWLFGLVCVVYVAAVMWLVLRRRLTLQASLTFIMMLGALGLFSFVVPYAGLAYGALGFQLPSNFFFTASIGALSFLHLVALTTISRLELRSITLIQEVALMQEQISRDRRLIERIAGQVESAGPVAGGGVLPPPQRRES